MTFDEWIRRNAHVMKLCSVDATMVAWNAAIKEAAAIAETFICPHVTQYSDGCVKCAAAEIRKMKKQ